MSFDIAGGLRNLLPGPLDSLRGPYDSLAAANGAVPSTIVNGKNFREGKFVEIGTGGVFKTYWWSGTGQYLNSDLVEYVEDPDLTNYAEKTTVYTKDQVYTKAETLPTSQLYNRTQLYTKSQVDQAIIGLSPDSETLIPIFDSKLPKTTISEVRTTPINFDSFLTTDNDKQGIWRYDPEDNISVDNTATVIVGVDNKRFKRIIESYVNLKWFGAKGDGITDDTQAVIQAESYSFAMGGGTIFVPVGTYITGTITVRKGVSFIGENKEKTIFRLKNNFQGDLFYVYNFARGRLSTMTLHGNKQNGAVGNGVYIAPDLDNTGSKSTASVIENLHITDFAKTGISCNKVSWIFTVRNNYIQFCDDHGIYNDTTDNGFYFNDISNCGKNGFYNFGGANTRIVGGKIISCGKSGLDNKYSGVYFESSNRCTVVGVECQDNYYSGFYISNSEQNSFIGVLADGNNAHSRPGATTTTGTTNWAAGNGYGFDLFRVKQSIFSGLATNYAITTPSQTAASRIIDSSNIDFDIRENNQLTTSILTNSTNVKKPDQDINPNNGTASFVSSWVNDQATIKIGGAGAGATNGLSIVGVASALLAKFNQDRSVLMGRIILDLADAITITNPNNPAASGKIGFFLDRLRIRLGGSGAGAGNGFSIQGAADTELFGVDGNGKATSQKLTLSNLVGGASSDLALIIDPTSKEVKTIAQPYTKTDADARFLIKSLDNKSFTMVDSGDAMLKRVTIVNGVLTVTAV